MKIPGWSLPAVLGVGLLTVGCASRPVYYAPPPPPPAYVAPPLIQRAQVEGFRIGTQVGARDVSSGYGHHPRADRAYHDTPGYDPGMGPYEPYRDAFRRAYIDGYERAFYRR